ncbi:phage antirepressor N-terminal domain-containing protein [Streptomyces sp. NPDC051315]|uniref:phage antirepressor N-terminal domain-containing protein n=1 Tax=Streptomyces sp. NPDC051315 TaxID=3365650 RepID=UPI0037A40B7E
MSILPHESTKVAKLDLSAGSIHTTLVDGQPHVILRPAIEALGLDWKNQHEKLKTRSWASVVQSTMQLPGDTQARVHSLAPVRTFLMLLATVNENRVKAETRPTLIAFQNETADAIEAYWTKGGAINERATDEQLDTLQQQIEERRIRRALGLVQLIAAMDDTVDPKWKRSRQLHHYAEAAGEIAEIAPEDRALLVEMYLKDRGLSKDERRSVRSSFGRRVSLAYEMQHGEKPKDSIGLVDGRERTVKSYTEADRPMFDKVWGEFYADRYPAQQRLGEAS